MRKRKELEFELLVTVDDSVTVGERTSLIVQLMPDTRPPDQRSDSLVVAFDHPHQPVLLEVSLSTSGFKERTGHWNRTLCVYPDQPSLPAVFLLEANLSAGERALRLNFYRTVGSALRTVQVLPPLPAGQPKGLEAVQSFAASATEPDFTDQEVDFHAKVDFPGQVRSGEEQPLVVQLTLQQAGASAAEAVGIRFADTRKPELIEVAVTAPGLSERTQSWRRVMSLYSHADSQPAVFLLQAGPNLGEQMITIDFYHRGRAVLCTAFVTRVVDQEADSQTPLMVKPGAQQLEPLPPSPPPPPDLELRIVLDQNNTMQFKLHSEKAELGYQRRDLGQVKLATFPRQYLDQLFVRLSELAATADASADEQTLATFTEEIETIGQGLFEELFPPELQKEYWQIKALREAGKVRTLLIISDEPWIPWELVKPYAFDPESNQEQNDGFLAETFQLSRWLAGRGPAPGVEIKVARLVAPTSNLAFTEREKEYFANLEQAGVEVGEPLATKSQVLQTMRSGEIKLLHLAAHGNFRADNVNESPLLLENDEPLRPSELAGARVAGLRRERPLVFLNACHSGQIDFGLTGLGGWAEKLVGDIGVSAFIGSLWEVNDRLAADFAISFYDYLRAGQTLGAAFLAARQQIRTQQPANPTWLAYTLYADPNGRVVVGDPKRNS